MNELREPIPHGEMLSQARHMGEGLDPAPDDMTDFVDPPWRGSPSLGSGGGWSGRLGELLGDWEGGEGEGAGIDM